MNSIYIFFVLNVEMEMFYKVLWLNLFMWCRWDCCRYLLNINNIDIFWLFNSVGMNVFKYFKNINIGESEFNKEDFLFVCLSYFY